MSPTENMFSSGFLICIPCCPPAASPLHLPPPLSISNFFFCSTKNTSSLWRFQPWLCPLPASPAQSKYYTLLMSARKDNNVGREKGIFSYGVSYYPCLNIFPGHSHFHFEKCLIYFKAPVMHSFLTAIL